MKKLIVLYSLVSLFNSSLSAQDAAKEKEIVEVVEEQQEELSIKAVIKTTAGDIEVKLYADKTPVTVANFCNLAARGFYKNTSFHRVVPAFVSQAGKHKSGSSGPGYTINNETYSENPDIKELKHDKAGILSMARLPRKHTNGSQFYITHKATSNLDGAYTVFGEVTKGLDIALTLQKGTVVTDIEILSDTSELLKQQAENVAKWNKVLDATFSGLSDLNLEEKLDAKEEKKADSE